jgi:hypothetical protein
MTRQTRRRRALGVLGTTLAAGLAAPAGAAFAVVPAVTTQAPAAVTFQSATLRGTVNPRNLATTYFFQYGPTAAYGAQTAPAALAAGASAVRVTGTVGALVPATTYHVRLVAQNATGTSVTADRTFRTPAQALGITVAATPNPAAFGGPTTLSGAVTGTGAAGRPVQIQQRPFPFAGGFANVGNALVTDARGRFSMAVLALPLTTQFRARVTDRAGVVSPAVLVGARAIVGTRVTSTRVRRGGRVHFSGTVRPSEPGRAIAIQKRRDGRWITLAGTVARPGGAGFGVYGKTIRVRRGGLFRVFLGTGSGATVPNVGRTIRIRTHR